MRSVPLALVLALAACASPPREADPLDGGLTAPRMGDLSDGQVAQLRGLGVPVLVPGPVGDFRLSVFEVNASATSVSYRLDYRRPDGACFQVSGANEGLGGPDYPLVYTEVQIDQIPGRPGVRVYEASDDPAATSAQVWGVQSVVSEYLEMDGMVVQFLSDTVGGCVPVTLGEGAALVAGMRMIAPGTASGPAATGDLGAFALAPDVVSDYNAASDPEVAAEAVGRRYEADDVTVEVLRETDAEAVALVTATGLLDDSVRDERLRLVYAFDGVGTWELVEAGRQVRCWPGRGHEGWSADRCL